MAGWQRTCRAPRSSGDGPAAPGSSIAKLDQVRGPRQTGVNRAPVGEQLSRIGNRFVAAARFLVAVPDLLDELRRVRLDFVALRHQNSMILRLGEILEERGAAVLRQHVPEGHDRDLIDRLDRPLRGRVVAPQRFNRVADELQPNGLTLSGGKHVEDAAADGELSVFIGRIFTGESRVGQQFGQIDRRDILARLQVDRGVEQAPGCAHARQQGRRRGDDDPGGTARHGVQRAGARGCHADVRSETAVRIDFMRGEREDGSHHGIVRETLERGEAEGDVGNCLFELAVARHDVQHGAVRQSLCGRRHVQRLGGRREARYRRRRRVHTAPGHGGLEQRTKVERGGGGQSLKPRDQNLDS